MKSQTPTKTTEKTINPNAIVGTNFAQHNTPDVIPESVTIPTMNAKTSTEVAESRQNSAVDVAFPQSPAVMPSISIDTGEDQVKSQSSPRMIKLFCFIIGHGNAFPVSIDANACVGGLQDAIVEKKRRAIDSDADELSLYAAKQPNGGTWLATDDPSYSNDIKALKNGTMTKNLQALIEEERELDPTSDVGDYFDESIPSRRVLLVKLP